MDTDYNQWAVLTQCTKSSNTSSHNFLSTRYYKNLAIELFTEVLNYLNLLNKLGSLFYVFCVFIFRILSRSRVLSSEHLQIALNVMKNTNPDAAFQYPVDQTSCEPRKKKNKISAIIKKMRAMRKTWTTTVPSTQKSDKKSRISAIIQKMREMRKKWTTPKPLTAEIRGPRSQNEYELITPSTQALKSKLSTSQNIGNAHNGSWRFDKNSFLYILLLHICTYLNSC